MIYPVDFIEKTKMAYPECKKLHQLLEEGDLAVGNYLDEASPIIPLGVILSSESLEELQDMARKAIEKIELYNEWLRIVQQNNG